MFKKLVISFLLFSISQFVFSQATLPLSRTIWNAGAPVGWTDSGTGSYTSSFACSGSNMGKLDNSGDNYQVFFSSTPGQLTFKLKSASMNASSSCLVEESADGASWSTLGTYGPGNTPITDCADIIIALAGTSRYVRWTYTKSSGNCGLDDVNITSGVPCAPNSEPTTNASTLNFSNINCNSLDLSWSNEGNGTNRIVVASTSAISGAPSDQTNYTANSIFGSGNTIAAGEFVVYNGTGTSFTVTGLTVSTTYHFAIFEYNGTSANCTENYYTTAVLTGNETTTSSVPSTNASAYTFSLIGCNGITLDWTSPGANGGSLVVIKAGSDVTTDPTDGTTYSANSNFGSGTDIGTNEFVVYDGNGTSVNINGLSASTTYFVNVFEYNGTGSCIKYRISDEISSSEVTVACTDCPYMTSMLVNSCDQAPCTEGDNEMFFFNSMDYYVSTTASDVTVNYGSSSPASGTYADSFTSSTDHDALDSMNADIGCANKFIDASTVNYIPAQSTFLLLNESICADAFDWSSICTGNPGNIYVLFSSDVSWGGTGVFANNPSGTRHFRTILEGCTIDYNHDYTIGYDNGAYVAWTPSGGAATYGTGGCALPATILPISLLYFKGKTTSSGNLLEWTTDSEINNDYFTIERSSDAQYFNEIGTINGVGNSITQLNYNFTDKTPYSGINYYRLKQTDFNGNFSYSNVITLSNQLDIAKVFISNNMLRIQLNDEFQKGNLAIIDALGRTIYSENISNSKFISLDDFTSGIYFIKINTPTNSIIRKVKL